MELEIKRAAPAAGEELPTVGDLVRYGIVLVQLTIAGARLRGLADQVGATYAYVERCAQATDRRADQMSSLDVDPHTVGAHHDAAAVMRGALDAAARMAAEIDALSAAFEEAAAAHEADYGAVAEAVQAMPVPMAQASFYANR
jgi:hypothetical protein